MTSEEVCSKFASFSKPSIKNGVLEINACHSVIKICKNKFYFLGFWFVCQWSTSTWEIDMTHFHDTVCSIHYYSNIVFLGYYILFSVFAYVYVGEAKNKKNGV